MKRRFSVPVEQLSAGDNARALGKMYIRPSSFQTPFQSFVAISSICQGIESHSCVLAYIWTQIYILSLQSFEQLYFQLARFSSGSFFSSFVIQG